MDTINERRPVDLEPTPGPARRREARREPDQGQGSEDNDLERTKPVRLLELPERERKMLQDMKIWVRLAKGKEERRQRPSFALVFSLQTAHIRRRVRSMLAVTQSIRRVNDRHREHMWCQLISHLRMFGDPLRFRILNELINHGFPMPEDKLAQHLEGADPASTIAPTTETPSPGPRVLCPRVPCPPVPPPPSGWNFLSMLHRLRDPDFMDDFPLTESEKRNIARQEAAKREAAKREAARRQHADANAQEEMVNGHSEGDGESGMDGDGEGEGDGEGVGPEDGQEGRGEARMTNDTVGHDRADNGHGVGMTNGVEEETKDEEDQHEDQTIDEEDQHGVQEEMIDEEDQHEGGDDGGLEGEEDEAAAITLEEKARCRHLLDWDQLYAQLGVTQLEALLDKCYRASKEFERILGERYGKAAEDLFDTDELEGFEGGRTQLVDIPEVDFLREAGETPPQNMADVKTLNEKLNGDVKQIPMRDWLSQRGEAVFLFDKGIELHDENKDLRMKNETLKEEKKELQELVNDLKVKLEQVQCQEQLDHSRAMRSQSDSQILSAQEVPQEAAITALPVAEPSVLPTFPPPPDGELAALPERPSLLNHIKKQPVAFGDLNVLNRGPAGLMMHDKRNFHPGGGRAVNPGQPAGRHNVGEEGFIGEAREREGQVTQVVPNGGEGRGAGRDGDRNETAAILQTIAFLHWTIAGVTEEGTLSGARHMILQTIATLQKAAGFLPAGVNDNSAPVVPPKPKQPAATLTVSSSSFPAHRPSLSLDRQNLGNSGCLASNARAHPHSHTNNQRQAPIISDHHSRNTIPTTDSATTERPSLLNHIKKQPVAFGDLNVPNRGPAGLIMHDKRNFHPGGGRAVNPGQLAGRHNVGEEGFIGEAREREGQVTQVVPNGGEGRGAGRDGDRNETAVGEASRDTAPDASPGLPLHVAPLAHTDLSVGAPAAAAGGGVVGGTQEGDEGTGVNAADQETLT
ncbi:unnamed protein product [Vitrella brassicaformis CCMP3155]|uniref:Uncharacterized protein n=1 Tax=Vitrella brassicaformis (strain CCMP3155) TaxID=1169540 RepID=A0A0G4G233_VITBC|nr:unnamed protein product [Vitrella brassicaformis CCMP3155]|eukprot:CEM22132.1 unnamed protein product [Vitrella brassicaformis CCMP3155]